MPANTAKKKISEQHWDMILRAIYKRACVPFLGAAANISKKDGTYNGLPLGPEVARRLIGKAIGVQVTKTKELGRVVGVHKKLEGAGLAQDLAKTWLENLPRVALHVDVEGRDDRKYLTGQLQEILDDKTCTPSPLLHALAELPFRLIVTTNFDDLLERALDGAMEKALAIAPADISEPVKIAAALQKAPDAACAYLRGVIDPAVLAQIDAWDGVTAPPQPLVDALAAELHRIAAGPSIYDPQRFPQAQLHDELKELAALPALSDVERLRMNRLLLEETFPFGQLRPARKKYRRVVQPMNGFDDDAAKQHAQNPPSKDILTVYKLHGSFDDPKAGVVITEDDYIHFLTVLNDRTKGIPNYIKAGMLDSALLFLGYSLEDWDFRTLYKAMVEPVPKLQRSTSFAVQWDPPRFWVDYWDRKGVVIYNMDIHAFAEELEKRYRAAYGSLSAAAAGV